MPRPYPTVPVISEEIREKVPSLSMLAPGKRVVSCNSIFPSRRSAVEYFGGFDWEPAAVLGCANCGHTVEFESVDDLPIWSTPCPNGCAQYGWIVRYTDQDDD